MDYLSKSWISSLLVSQLHLFFKFHPPIFDIFDLPGQEGLHAAVLRQSMAALHPVVLAAALLPPWAEVGGEDGAPGRCWFLKMAMEKRGEISPPLVI
jgi:hypothetical protein